MSYYKFDRPEILQKAKERYSKEKAAEYYVQNKETINEKSKNWYKNLSQEEKDKIKEYQKKSIKNWFNTKKKHYKMNNFCFFHSIIRMSEKTLKFDNIRVNKKEFHKSKQPIDLSSISVDKIVVSDKSKYSDNGFKYLIGYKESEMVQPLCIILPEWVDT